MSSRPRSRTALVALLVVLGVAFPVYSILIRGELLLGALVGGSLLVAAYALHSEELELTPRLVVTWGLVGLVVVYGVLTSQVLAGVLVGAVVYLVAWVTDPGREWAGN